MAKDPSRKQLDFLDQLGYRGKPPETMTEASIVIDSMLESKNSKKAEAALRAYRSTRPREGKNSCLGCLLIIVLAFLAVFYVIGRMAQNKHPQPQPQLVNP